MAFLAPERSNGKNVILNSRISRKSIVHYSPSRVQGMLKSVQTCISKPRFAMVVMYSKLTPPAFQASNRHVCMQLKCHGMRVHIFHQCTWLLVIRLNQKPVQIKCSQWKFAKLRWHCAIETKQLLTVYWQPSWPVSDPNNLNEQENKTIEWFSENEKWMTSKSLKSEPNNKFKMDFYLNFNAYLHWIPFCP